MTLHRKKIPIPYKHQTDAFNYTKYLNFFALFMEQGTGKTKVIIMKCLQLFLSFKIDKMVVVCPNALKYQWAEELEIHYSKNFNYYIFNATKLRGTKKENVFFDNFLIKDRHDLKVMIINYESFQSDFINKYLKRFTNSNEKDVFIVLDESTKIKNPQAKRTKKIVQGFKNRKYKAILTGTPTPNSPIDLYSQFDFLQKDFFKMSFFHFKHHYSIIMNIKSYNNSTIPILLDEKFFNVIKSRMYQIDNEYPDNKLGQYEKLTATFGIKLKDLLLIKKMPFYNPYKNIEELNDKISKYTFKVMKKDCLDLPEKVYEKIIVELSNEQKKIYKQLQKEMLSKYEGKQLSVTNKLVLVLRLQMITGGNFPYSEEIIQKIIDNEGNEFLIQKEIFKSLPIKSNSKIDALLDDLENVSNNTSIIIWSSFVNELKLIYEKLKEKKYLCGLYYGKTSDNERKNMIKNFKDKKIQILVINPSTGQFGLNLQISTLHYFYSNTYRAEDRLQAEDRSHRIGQKNNVTYKDIICKDTIDEKVYKSLKRKEDLINFFRDKKLNEIIF